jgi:hypothetical protein
MLLIKNITERANIEIPKKSKRGERSGSKIFVENINGRTTIVVINKKYKYTDFDFSMDFSI